MAVNFDFFNQWSSIVNGSIENKFKKKFLRKTNTAEQSDQFASLALQCERADLRQYAALSYNAAAKSESTLGHSNEEAVLLAKAGRLMIQAEKNSVVNCGEHLQDGLRFLRQAELLWDTETKKPLAAGLCLETGCSLEVISPYDSATYYSRAGTMLDRSPAQKLHALSRLASAKISLGDYEDALTVFTDMVATVKKITSVPFGVYNDILVRCEISRILLILLLRPTPRQLSPELAQLVEKYIWIGKPDPTTISLLGEELFFLLQSLVMASQSEDLEAFTILEGDIWKYLSNEQREMLRIVIEDMNNIEK